VASCGKWLVLIEGESGEATRMDHLGVEGEQAEQVTAATQRIEDAGLAAFEENDTPAATPCRTRSGFTAPARSRGRSTSSRPRCSASRILWR
jgi:hypothetical protein